MNGWYPQINARGDIASGAGEIWVNNVYIAPGHGPQWLTDDQIIFNAGTETVCVNVPAFRAARTDEERAAARQTLPIAYNHMSAGNNVWWGFLQMADPQLHAYHGFTHCVAVLEGTGHAQISRDGRFSIYVQPYHAEQREIILNDHGSIGAGLIMDYSVCTEAAVWSAHPGTGGPHARIVRGRKWNQAEEDLHVLEWEGPIVTDGPDGPWILSITQGGLILRPWGQTWGYQWAGEYFYPCIRFLGGEFTIASSSAQGVLQVQYVNPNAPRVDLAPQPQPPDPEPEPEPEPPMPAPNWSEFYVYLEQRWAALPKTAASVDQAVREYHHGTAPATAGHPGFGFLKKEGGSNYEGHSEDWILEKLADGSVWGTDVILNLGLPTATVSHNTPTPEPNPQNWMQPKPLSNGGNGGGGDPALEARVAELEQQVQYLMAHQVTLPTKIALRSSTDPNLAEHLRGKVFCVDSNQPDQNPDGLGYFNRDGVGPWETLDFIVVK